MAGLYDSNQFVILTGESQYQMKHLHDRTPLLMTKDEMYQYLRFAYDPIVKNKNIKIESVEEKKNR